MSWSTSYKSGSGSSEFVVRSSDEADLAEVLVKSYGNSAAILMTYDDLRELHRMLGTILSTRRAQRSEQG